MVNGNNRLLEIVETWRATAFLIAGVISAADALILVLNLTAGTQEQYMTLGQAFIGAAWTVGFIGLFGFYPALRERSKWLSRVGGVCAVIGLLTMVIMAVIPFSLFVGVLGGTLSAYTPYFLPGVFLGIVFGFFGVTSLRTGVYTPRIGLSFLLLVVTFLFNLGTGIAGVNPLSKVLVVVVTLILTNLAISYTLRTGGAAPAHDGITPT